jgi:hypothetical protein
MTPENLTPRKIAEFKKGYISVKCLDAAFLGSAERLGLAIPCPRAYEESADSLHCSGCTAYRASGTPASMKAPVENRMEAAGAKQPLPTPCHDASGGGLHWPMPGITFGSKRSTGSGAVLNAQRGSCEAVQYGSRRAHSDRQRRRTAAAQIAAAARYGSKRYGEGTIPGLASPPRSFAVFAHAGRAEAALRSIFISHTFRRIAFANPCARFGAR